MSDIKKVTLVGASGTLGPAVLEALLSASFDVTVFTRSKATSKVSNANVKLVEVDFTSLESLITALSGQDAVVSTISMTAVEGQTILIDAAVAAGVKRFIPSEFGSCTDNPELSTYPIYSSMAKIHNYLVDKSKATTLSYTVVACGAFLDMVLETSSIVNFDNQTATLFDGGDNRMSATTLAGVGTAIVGVLRNLGDTKNRVVHVSETILTQNKVISIFKELRPDAEWSTTIVDTSLLLKESLEMFAAGEYGFPAVMKLLVATAHAGDKYGCAFDVTDNKLLGVSTLSEHEIKALIAQKVGKA